VSGARTDIGADEFTVVAPILGIALNNGQALLQLTGSLGDSFVWERSDTLSNWTPFLTNLNLTGVLQATNSLGGLCQFFRARIQ